MIDLLQKLMQFKTVSMDVPANLEAFEYCQEWLKNKGIPSEIRYYANKPMLLWGADTQVAEVLLNSHTDVVPGPNEIFTPRIEDGKIYGRGSADTKSSNVILMDLSTEMYQTLLDKKIACSLVSDEEIGGHSTNELVKSMSNLKFAFFGEPSDEHMVVEAKGIMQVKITAHGSNAHGSRPWQGENAIEKMMESLHAFKAVHPTPTEETFDTTYNFSVIRAGEATNQIPDKCELTVDIRINPKQAHDEVFAEIKKYFGGADASSSDGNGSPADFDVLLSESPIFTSHDNEYIKKFSKVLVSQGVKEEFEFQHGSSDARHCTALSIPALVFGPIGKNLHENQEWADVQSIETCRAVLKEFIQNL